CKGLPNGAFLRDSQSCAKFYVCANGHAIPRTCPGVLYFDIKKKVCNFPSLVDCSHDEKSVYIAKKPVIFHAVPQDVVADVANELSAFIPDCSSADNGDYIRDPRSCSKFYACANGKAIPRQCPRGLYINIKEKYCDFPSRVKCSIGISRPLMLESVPGKLDCSDKAEGSIMRDSKLCNKYYVCLNGSSVTHFCTPGNWFDLKRGVCNNKLMVEC
ncbi:hypothetical protein KR093_000571, partial [Drosophila rubida]